MIIFLATLIQITVILMGSMILSPEKIENKYVLILLLASQVIGYSLFQIIGVPAIFIVILFLVIMLRAITKKIWVNLINIFIVIIVMVAFDYLMSILLSFFILGFTLEALVEVILGSICSIMTILKLKKIFIRNGIYKVLDSSYSKILGGLVSCTFVIIYMNILTDEYLNFPYEVRMVRTVSYFFYALSLIVISIVFGKMYTKEVKASANKKVTEEEMKNIEHLSYYMEQMEASYGEIKAFRHDYQNILLGFHHFILTKDLKGLEEYYLENVNNVKMLAVEDYNSEQFKNLQIREVKGLIGAKIIKAKELGVNLHFIVVKPIERINVDKVDLCRILGILIDNAIEEASTIEGGEVKIAFIKENRTVKILISNSCKSMLPTQKEMFTKGFSTKGSKRGVGLNNLKNILNKYPDVSLKTIAFENVFTQEIKIVLGED